MKVYTDGSSNGYYGYQIDNNEPKIYHSSGKITNNQAEFEALLALLHDLPEGTEVDVYSDSLLLVNGYIQSWSLKNPKLIELRNKMLDLTKEKKLKIMLAWIPREQNLFGKYLDHYKVIH